MTWADLGTDVVRTITRGIAHWIILSPVYLFYFYLGRRYERAHPRPSEPKPQPRADP